MTHVRDSRTLRGWLVPLLLILLSLIFWWRSLGSIDPDKFTDFGIVTMLFPYFIIAFVILTFSFCRLVFRQTPQPLLLGLHVLALIVIIHATLPLIYAEPRYSWVYKHLGVVEYLRRTGTLDPALDIYNNWPGFFGLSALFDGISGADHMFTVAAFGQFLFNVIDAAALYLCFSALTSNKRLVWLCIWGFVLTNWVGSDYFSPQAFAYFLHLVLIGLLVAFFYRPAVPKFDWLGRFPPARRLAQWLNQLAAMTRVEHPPLGATTFSQRIIIGLVITALYFVIVSSHQLTPFMTIVGVAALVITLQTRGRLVLVLMLLTLYLWLNGPASTYMRGQGSSLTSSFGKVSENLNQRLDIASPASTGRVFVSWTSRGFTAAVWGVAGLGILWNLRRKRINMIPMVLAFTPFPFIVAQSYGGEMLFRVQLFALPWMVYLAIEPFMPRKPKTSWLVVLAAVVVCCAVFAGFAFSGYGTEIMNNFTSDEVAARDYVYQNAPAGSLILTVNYNMPAKYTRYEQYVELDLTVIEELANKHLTEADIPTIVGAMQTTDWLYWQVPKNAYFKAHSPYASAYIIVSRGQYLYANLMTPGSPVDDIAAALARSNQFKLVYSNADAQVYLLAEDVVF